MTKRTCGMRNCYACEWEEFSEISIVVSEAAGPRTWLRRRDQADGNRRGPGSADNGRCGGGGGTAACDI